MKNNTKTSMILSTTTIALLVVMLTPNAAFASTPWYGGSALPNGDAGFWFHCTSLNVLNVDGDTTDNCTKVQSKVGAAMVTYNNLGNSIDYYNTPTFTDHWVYATNLGLFGNSAEATYPNIDDGYVRFNNLRSFGTTGGCQTTLGITYAYNLQWLSHHELGHSAGLLHAPQTDTSTMVPTCKSTWSTVQTQDDSVLDSHYP
ncbi:MAG: hypothetical protein COY74_02900 [Nitrosopumilales archaeon CG_4_10_14_0_8_um_filter_34_8]|nr:MAG: hypothetical protein COY74_02900 [Nitrosopumilales archaeon CG_4_10_14_0_8_um_filter_34_8]